VVSCRAESEFEKEDQNASEVEISRDLFPSELTPQSVMQYLFGKKFSESIFLGGNEVEPLELQGSAVTVPEDDQRSIKECLRAFRANQQIIGNMRQPSKNDLLEIVSNQIRINAKMVLLAQKHPSVLSLLRQALKEDSQTSNQSSLQIESIESTSKCTPPSIEMMEQTSLNVCPPALRLNSSIRHWISRPPTYRVEVLPSLRNAAVHRLDCSFNSNYQFYMHNCLNIHREIISSPRQNLWQCQIGHFKGHSYEASLCKSVHFILQPMPLLPRNTELRLTPPQYSYQQAKVLQNTHK